VSWEQDPQQLLLHLLPLSHQADTTIFNTKEKSLQKKSVNHDG
jgi:hypothetical protein